VRTFRDAFTRLIVLAAAALLLGAGCGGAGTPRGKVEHLLHVELPGGIDDVRYHRWQPSDQITFYTAYVKLGGPRADLVSVVDRLHLHRYGDRGARPYLPTGWQTMPQVKLDWWDATGKTPPESWAAPFGVAGRIVAKLERGHLYVIATDNGLRPETTSGG
jgi:hypothetical protein